MRRKTEGSCVKRYLLKPAEASAEQAGAAMSERREEADGSYGMAQECAVLTRCVLLE